MDAYDRLKLLQNIPPSKGARFLVPTSSGISPGTPSGGPSAPTEPPGSVVPTDVATFLVADEDMVRRYSGPRDPNLGWSSPPLDWPPEGWILLDTAGEDYHVGAAKKRLEDPAGNRATYFVSVAMMRFDTSSLPDSAQIASVTLRLSGLNAVEYTTGRNLTFEWQSWSPPFGVEADWTATEGGNANAGIPLSALPLPANAAGAWTEIPLANANANVSRTSYTYIKGHISGGAPPVPSGAGYFGYYSGAEVVWDTKNEGSHFGGSTNTSAQLIVNYA